VHAHLWKGQLGEAWPLADEASEAASLLDDPTATAIALGAGARDHVYDGRGERARAEALEALAPFERLQLRAGAISRSITLTVAPGYRPLLIRLSVTASGVAYPITLVVRR
jgi:hypothetical protein